MKHLERVIFVNWYLFDSQQFDLRGDVLITGSNGSGKTSLLDAIQVVALGGHGHDIQLNANAGEKGERSIKGYCLGQLSNEDGNGGFSVIREDAITHLALVFTDEKTGESTTIGICMSAKKSMPKHEVHGLYVAEGMKLSLDDYLASSTQGDIPLSWAQFKNDLMRKSEQKGVNPFVFGQPEKYRKQLCLSLGPKGRQLDQKKFVHSFKKAVNLKDIDNVSDFVKLFVLDENPININKLDESVTIYKEMLEVAKGVTAQLDLMADIDKSFKKWDRLLKDSIAYEWVEKEYKFILADLKRSELEDSQRALIEAYWKVLKNLKECDANLHSKKQLAIDLKQQIDSDDRESKSRALIAEIDSLETKISSAKKALQQNITSIQSIAGLGRYSQYFTDSAKALVAKSEQMLPKGEMEALSWPKKPVKTDADANALLSDIKLTLEEYSKKKDDLAIEHNKAAKDFASEENRLRQLESGASDVSQNTLALQRALENEGIEATPLCDLAEITDVSWQPVIESYLGSNVEALFVASNDDAERAVQIFKDMNRKKSLYGASVINTRKVGSWKTKIDPRSCAAFIKSENSIVEAFLSRMLNRLIRVQTAADLIKEDIAITSEGMLSKSGSIKKLRMPRNLILGKKARERTLEQLKERLADDGAKLETLRKSKDAVNELYDLLNTAFGKLKDWKFTVDLQKDCKASEEARDLKTKQFEAIDLNHLAKIRAEHKVVTDLIEELDEKRTDLLDRRGSMRSQHDAMHDKAVDIIERVDICAEERVKIESLSLFDMELAGKKEEQLRKEQDNDDGIMKLAASKKEMCLTKSNRHEQNGLNDLRDYCIRFKITRPEDEASTCELWTWLVDNMKRLNDTELAKYEGDARRALFDAEQTFKTDVALKLRENISSMKRLISELNRSLKTRPFSGGEIYQFHYSVNSEYEDIIKFVEKTTQETQANAGSLLDQEHDLTNVLIERIKVDKAAVSDYRNYFSYDIKIRSEGSKTISKLSKRMGVASGGENRTPYYVTIGASMASAYRISSNDIHSNDGIGLIPLDEAFHKMDGNNYFQAGQYIKDIGLQMILAAPDDAQIKLLPLVETVIFLSRHGENISSNVTYLKNGVAELLASDNPDLNPALLEVADNG